MTLASIMCKAKQLLLSLLASLFLHQAVHAEQPKVEYLYPAGAEQGTTVTLTIGGKLDPWPLRFWSSCPDLVPEAGEKKGVVTIQVPAKVPLGRHLIRGYNAEGASKPRTFIVGHIGEIIEKESNDHFRAAQKIDKTPITINGQLSKSGDTDSYAIELKKGQWLIAKVESYGIGSPLDSSLHLRDANGYRLGEALDSQNLDPLLAYQAKQDGVHVLQISGFAHPPRFDVRLYGTGAAVYRLSVYTGPYVRYAMPLAIHRNTAASVRLHGWNLNAEDAPPLSSDVDASALAPGCESHSFPLTQAENLLEIMVRDTPQIVEVEPNNKREEAQVVTIPAGISGHIGKKNDRDTFSIDAKKGRKIRFDLRSWSLGFDLDPVLTIYDAEGKNLSSGDDVGKDLDPKLTWRCPADGTYTLEVRDRYGKGGQDFAYHLEMVDAAPGIKAAAESDNVRLDHGTTTSLKVTVSRIDGDRTPLIATAVDLPDGVISTSASVPEKGGDVTLTLSATKTVKNHSGLFRILLLGTDPSSPRIKQAQASLDLELPVGKQLIEATDRLWLTVVAAKPEKES